MASNDSSKKGLFQSKFPVIYTILICLCFIGIIYWQSTVLKATENSDRTNIPSAKECVSRMEQLRSSDYKFIRPLYLTDVSNESDEFALLKKDVSNLIEQKTNAGILTGSGVYFRKLNDGSWFSLNANETFDPGSLIKIPIMITFLKMAEFNPSLLNKEILFKDQFSDLPKQSFTEKTIEPGKRYTIRDLLYHMIVFSDNNATILLTQNINSDVFQKLFKDLQLPTPPFNSSVFPVSAFQISKFMRILYSATYINENSAEFALSLLSQSKFKDGIVAGLPSSIICAHKFGEAGPADMRELSETAIVYIGKETYLLTVMTRGKDINALAGVIKEISSMIYFKMSQANTVS